MIWILTQYVQSFQKYGRNRNYLLDITTLIPKANIFGNNFTRILSKKLKNFKTKTGNLGIGVLAVTPPERGKIENSQYSFKSIFKSLK